MEEEIWKLRGENGRREASGDQVDNGSRGKMMKKLREGDKKDERATKGKWR